MKKRIFALLCALGLLLPALCSAYTCDSCDYEGPFTEVVTGEEVRNGAPGQWLRPTSAAAVPTNRAAESASDASRAMGFSSARPLIV